MSGLKRTQGITGRIAAVVAGLVVALPGWTFATVATDSLGDASGFHDVASVSGVYSSTEVLLGATFAAGTLNPATLGFTVGLDLDQNPNTGVAGESVVFPLGAEFIIGFNASGNATHANVFNWVTLTSVGSVPVTFATDQLQLAVPLSLLSNDDGAMGFGIAAGVPQDAQSTVIHDFAPDSSNNGPLTTITSPVPEPASLGVLALAAAALVRRRGQKRD